MIDTIGIERACPPDETVDLVALGQQQLRQVRTVLPRDASDQRSFHPTPPSSLVSGIKFASPKTPKDRE